MYEGVGLRAFAGAAYSEEHKAAAKKAADEHDYQTHMRLSKELRGIRDWYPSIFELLFDTACQD